jgi:hypothetical protein
MPILLTEIPGSLDPLIAVEQCEALFSVFFEKNGLFTRPAWSRMVFVH